jgi:hypothetical protein
VKSVLPAFVAFFVLASLALTAPAQAHTVTRAGLALQRGAGVLEASQASCPAGVPVQTITLVNLTGENIVTGSIERALVDQSLQLRAAWGTPCVRFGFGGWLVYLQLGGPHAQPGGDIGYQVGGDHYGAGIPGPNYAGQPYAIVQTGNLTWTAGAARGLSHELDEMLVDPQDETRWKYGLLEVCDPVQNLTHDVDGIPVSDFVLPSYFFGGAWPYDYLGVLSEPTDG